jgi:LysM repeat protein
MARRDRRRELARIAAPVAFLLAVTIAVLLIRSGLHHSTTATEAIPPTVPTTTRAAGTTTGSKPKAAPKSKPNPAAEYYTVGSGDTFGSIATKYGTTVQEIETLNPGVSSSALSVGQRVRVK